MQFPIPLLLASLELVGRIEPPPFRATVTIEGLAQSRRATTIAGSSGRFRFRKLPPGPYVVTVFARGAGMMRRSVEVTPGLADSKGRVETTIPFSESLITPERSRRFRSTVSIKELSIPDRARREFEEARARLRKGDPAGATSHLRRAVEIAPQYMFAWNELGLIAYRAHDWGEAERCLRKALEIRPGSVATSISLGGALLAAGKYQDALPFNRFSVERSPANALANFQLGMNYYMMERDEQSLKYLEIAKNLDPASQSNPQLALANIHARRGDRTAEIRELEDFLQRHPDSDLARKVRDELDRLKTALR